MSNACGMSALGQSTYRNTLAHDVLDLFMLEYHRLLQNGYDVKCPPRLVCLYCVGYREKCVRD